MSICPCCGLEKDENWTCPHCMYFENAEIGDESFQNSRIEQYRKSAQWASSNYAKMLQLKDVSVLFSKVVFPETGEFKASENRLVIAKKGIDCYLKVVRSKSDFAQQPVIDDDGKSISYDINFCYEYNGAVKKASTRITPLKCEDFWHVGVMINENLELFIFVGRGKTVAQSSPVKLNL